VSLNAHKELQRIEAFSDAVFAIACTLLILEITVPRVEETMRPGALWPALKAAWPSFVAYLISFETLFIAWAGHHRGLNMLVRSSKAFLYSNGLLLLTITFMPFPTAVLAEYINTPQANVAATFYSAAMLVTNLSFLVWWLTMFQPVRLLPSSLTRAMVRTTTVQMLVGCLIYAGTTVLSYWFPLAGVVIIFLSQALWIVISVTEDEQVG
jgi:uncharacterized membrane protein